MDGSAKGTHAAWSVIIVWQDFEHGRTMFGGAFGDSLHSAGEQGFMGEPDHDALHAEQVAVCFALLWILQAPAALGRSLLYEVHYDCMAAGAVAAGEQATVHDSRLSERSRGLSHAAEAFLRQNVAFRHVPSHHGHAWNEAADVVAKYQAGLYNGCGDLCIPALFVLWLIFFYKRIGRGLGPSGTATSDAPSL